VAVSEDTAPTPSKPPPRATLPTALARPEGKHAAILCDVEIVATVVREAGLDLEGAPTALAAAAGGESGVRRVYALGNRFSRLRRVLEDAGYERVAVEGTPASLRLRMAVDAVDLSHRDLGTSFLLAASGDEIQPLIERLEQEGRAVTLFGAEALVDLPGETRGRGRGERDEAAPAPAPRRARVTASELPDEGDVETDEDEDLAEESEDERLEDGGLEDGGLEDGEYEDETLDDDEDDDDFEEAFDDEDAFDEDAFDDFDDDALDDETIDGETIDDETIDDEMLDDEADEAGDGFVDEPRREARPVAIVERPAERARAASSAPAGPRPARPQRSDERRQPAAAAYEAQPAATRRDAEDPFGLLLGAIERIVQGQPRLVFESVVRQEILEMEPGFNEREAGFGSFTEFFEEAQERGLIELAREPATGTYLVVGARLRD
jgi:hypothetical protein